MKIWEALITFETEDSVSENEVRGSLDLTIGFGGLENGIDNHEIVNIKEIKF